jgi:predicted enzyme related to lactoylglutathione lyase
MDPVEKTINYIEIPTPDPAGLRDFFAALFGWSSQDWGEDYISFNDGYLEGGFRRADRAAPAEGVLLVFYSTQLERDRARVIELGARISQDIFDFPGGRRFHFVAPSGVEFAVWSDGGP